MLCLPLKSHLTRRPITHTVLNRLQFHLCLDSVIFTDCQSVADNLPKLIASANKLLNSML